MRPAHGQMAMPAATPSAVTDARMSLLARLLGPRRRTAALEERVQACLRAGDLVNARALIERALALAPRAAAIHHLSGLVALREGRTDVAVAHLQTATAAEPDSPAMRYDFAEALRLSGRPAEALDAYQAVLRALPEQADALLGLAESLADAGDTATARITLERARAALRAGNATEAGAGSRRAGGPRGSAAVPSFINLRIA